MILLKFEIHDQTHKTIIALIKSQDYNIIILRQVFRVSINIRTRN